MNRPTTAQVNVPLRPDPDAEVPAHLRGTRAAIFHLLRVARAPKDVVRPCPQTAVVATQPRPARVRQQAPALPAHCTELQEFLHGDQFEFLSAETPDAALHNRYASAEPVRKAG